MAEAIRKAGAGTILLCLEGLAVLAVILVLAIGFVMWRLNSGPVNIDFAKSYIEQALNDPVSGHSVTLGKVVVEWPDLKRPLMLEVEGAGLIRNNQPVLSVGRVDIGLAGLPLFFGKVEPILIVLSEPSLMLVRTQDNKIRLNLEDEDIPEDSGAPDGANPFMRIIDTLSRPAGSVDKRSPIDRLQSLEIKNASMVIEDHVLGMTWYLSNLDMAFARDVEGLALSASVQLPGGRNGASLIQADAVYSRDARDFKANLHIQDFDPRILSRKIGAIDWLTPHEIYLNGNISAHVDSGLQVLAAAATLSAGNGYLDLEGVYDMPFFFESMNVDVSYDGAAREVDIKDLSLHVQDVAIKTAAKIKQDESGRISAPVALTIPAVSQAQIKAMWPQTLKDTNAALWMTQRLSDGTISNVTASLDLAAEKKEEGWKVSADHITADFDIAGMTVDYRHPMMPAKNAGGKGRFANDVLEVVLDGASIGDMAVKEGSVRIDKIMSDDVGSALIKTKISGPLKELFNYIAREPIAMSGDDLGIDTKKVAGTAALDVTVSFPTMRDLPAEKVKVTAAGTLSDVVLPDVVKTLDLTGGPLSLKVGDGQVSLSGKALLEGRHVNLAWQQYLESKGKPYSAKVTADINVDQGLRDVLGIGLDDWMEGTMPAHVVYTEQANGRADVTVSGDAGPVRLMVKPFEYDKPIGEAAAVTCKAVLQNGFIQEVRDLEVEAPQLRMTGANLKFETVQGESVLRRGSMPRVTLGENDAALDFEVGAGGRLKLGVKGAFFDARPFLKKEKNKGPYTGPPLLVSIDAARMRTHDTRLVDKAKIYLDLNREGMVDQLEMDAVAGKGAVYMRLKPDGGGKMTFRLEADDAGAALRAFKIYDNVEGGRIAVYGEALNPKQNRTIYGNAQLTNFRVVKAPALARLVSALGPAGLPQLLSNEGLAFSRLESKFEWYMRRPGDIYAVTDGRTSGSSLGLTFEGQINKEANKIDIKGHVVPISEVNSLLSNIPLIGDILTGGEGGAIFAATYTIKGPVEKPDVSVNPLSVLAPGIIRRMLFEE